MVIKLIQLYKDQKDKFDDKITKKTHVWKEIAKIIRSEHDLNVTHLQCERKQNLHPRVKVDQAVRPLPPKHLAFW